MDVRTEVIGGNRAVFIETARAGFNQLFPSACRRTVAQLRAAGPGEGDGPAGPPPELLRLQRRMNVLMWVSVGLGVVVLFLMGLI